MTEVGVILRRGRELTAMQRSLWASQAKLPASPHQNMALLWHIEAALDVDRLVRAFSQVVSASDALSTTIASEHGHAVVLLRNDLAASEVLAMSREQTFTWAASRAAVVMDPTRSLFDSVIISHPDHTVSWFLNLHHSITDATASALVFDATAKAYAGSEPELASYYDWADGRSEDPRTVEAREYWRNIEVAPRVGRIYGPAGDPSAHADRFEVSIDHFRGRLESLLAGRFASISDDMAWTTFLLTATAVLVHRTSGATSFAVGLPLHNRSGAPAQAIIGPAMEVFPVKVEIEPNDSFETLHRRIGRSALQTIRRARPGAAPNQATFETVVNVIPRGGVTQFGDVPATTTWVHPGVVDPSHLLRVQLTTYAGGPPRIEVDVNHAVGSHRERSRLREHFGSVLASFVNNPDAQIGSFALINEAELNSVEAWATGPEPAQSTSVDVVARLSDAMRSANVVLEDPRQSIIGPDAWDKVLRVASWLKDRGVSPGVRVGIRMERSVEAVLAIYSVLAAGGSFVPLDPAQPANRLERLAKRAKCHLVLTELPADVSAQQISEPVSIDLASEAYLLFTSGSTGEPKGVPVNHQGLADYLEFAHSAYIGSEPPVAALFTPLGFDLTITSLFVPVLAGGRLIAVAANGLEGLQEVARRTDITWLKATPSHLEILIRLVGDDHGLDALVVGGEAFASRLARQLWQTFGDVEIFNEYGPTEAVVGCMYYRLDRQALESIADVPIGVPAPGVSLRVVDQYLQTVPLGAVGELLIASRGLTVGYLENSDGADPGEEKFVELAGKRYYRSGDLVRLVDEKTLVYQGRLDSQIKVGGIRLEPTEVEAELEAHPGVRRAAARIWSPGQNESIDHCSRCGLPSDVPGQTFDEAGVCSVCHDYERIAPQADAYFGTPADLSKMLANAQRDKTGQYDCVHLLSGGKDSTYALYQLVELGFKVFALTLDNGFISEGAKANVRASVDDLGIDHEFMTTEVMNEIFADSLKRHSNVCHGCYKTIYTLATTKANQLGAPIIFTGLSRGQLFETRLIPAQFTESRFDPVAIDDAVLQARRAYHSLDDGPNRLLDTGVFADGTVFDRISYVDFYRYTDVSLAEMLDFLDNRAPWVRPSDTGRSTNCLINAAGIHAHITEQGYHNYAEPYAWDVRLGHKTRDEAIDELDDQSDLAEIQAMLAEVGYEPKPREVFTAWLELEPGMSEPTPGALRAFLSDTLPTHAIPAAFVIMDELPTSANGKLAESALPRPDRIHRAAKVVSLESSTATERRVIAVWERVLGTEPIGLDDDFFALGGDSLAALEMVVALAEDLGVDVAEEVVFSHTSPRGLAAAIAALANQSEGAGAPASEFDAAVAPAMNPWEQAFIFEHMNDPESPRQNVGRRYVVDGRVDVARLVEAIHATVDRHPPLRRTATEDRSLLPAMEAAEVSAGFSPVSEDAFIEISLNLIATPIDLDAGPLLRFAIHPMVGGSTGIVVVAHHAVTDASSFDRIWLDIDAAYSGSTLGSIVDSYEAHAQHNAQLVADADLAWVDAEPLAASKLSLPATQTEVDGYVIVPASFTRSQLQTVEGASPTAVILGGLVSSLSGLVQGELVTVGLPISTKAVSATELAGCWLNTVPTHIAIPAGVTNAQLARDSAVALATSLARRMAPQSAVNARRRANNVEPISPEVLFAFSEFAPVSLGGVPAHHEVMTNSMVRAPLTFFAEVRGEEISLALEYDGSLIGEAQAHELLRSLDDSVAAIISEPLAPAIRPFNSLCSLIFGQAQTSPSTVAVVCDHEVLTYGDLIARADHLAHELRSNGMGIGDKVGIYARRSVSTMVAVLGVLRSGGAYVPLDPDYPQARLHHIANDAGLSAVVTTAADTAVAKAMDLAVIDVDSLSSQSPSNEPLPNPGPEDLAYVIYTSGSTGQPKGIGVTHANIAFSTLARSEVYPRDPEAFLMVSSFAFDSSMVGLFWTLTTGGALVLPADGTQSDVVHLGELIDRHETTHLLAVPALYRVLIDEVPEHRLRNLNTVIVAGEPCPAELVAVHYSKLPGASLHNEYGPTETTVWTHHYEFEPDFEGAEVPIGTAIPGVSWAIVNTANEALTHGETGELVISGPGVAAGYVGRSDQTAAAFSDSTSFPGTGLSGRTYRTGDLVRLRSDGLAVFVGRVDRQLKVHGFRLEPEQIEAQISSVDGVLEAAVGLAGNRLVAWVASANSADPAEADRIRTQLEPTLAEHEVPTVIKAMADLPRTVNGKVDYEALGALTVAHEHAPRVGGHGDSEHGDSEHGGSEVEKAVGQIWADVLGAPDVGPQDNFFDLGGDSILNMRIVARMRQSGFEVKPRDVFSNPTVAELARAVSSTPQARSDNGRASMAGEVPMLEMQRWFFNQKFTNPNHWNQSLWLEVDSDSDLDCLEAAAQHLPEHHEVLRSVFTQHSSGWTQSVASQSDGIQFTRYDARDVAPETVVAEQEAGLDIESGNLARVGLLLMEGAPVQVFVTVHHLVVDGVSWAALLDDWTTAYEQVLAGFPVDIGRRSDTQQDWAAAIEAADLPSEWPQVTPISSARPPVSETITCELAVDFSPASDVELDVVAAVAQIWAQHTSSRRVELVMESHGRDADLASELDLTRTIGWFTSQYPVIVELTDVENRESCRVAARTALDDIELSGLGYDSGSGVGTLPGLALNYLGQLDRAIPAGKLFRPTSTLRAGIDPLNHRPHDVGVVAWLSGGELHVILDAASSAVSQTELNQLGESLRDLLSPAVITTGTVDDATLGALGSILDELDL